MEQLVASINRHKSTLGFGVNSFKSGPKVVWRWVFVCMVLGSAVAVTICGLLVGFGDLVIRQQNSFVFQPSVQSPDVRLPQAQQHSKETPQCRGKRVYVYNLPPLFNVEVLEAYCQNKTIYYDMCEKFANQGMGFKLEHVMDPLDAWYRTDQFSLDLLFHERMKRYPCLTNDSDIADLFYAPFYAALDVTQYLFSSQIHLRDKRTQRFLGWLMAQPAYNRLQGRKHVLILGRIVWDFSRKEEMSNWGGSLLSAKEVENVTSLLLERDPAANIQQVAVPYPTSFHPRSDAELKLWQGTVSASKRDILVSFAGAPRNKSKGVIVYAYLRDNLFEQCSKSDDCTPLLCDEIDCPVNPHLVTNLLLRSTFCLQPPGDSPTRKAVFDCLVAGSIPVFFTIHTAYNQYFWHLPKDGEEYSLMFDEQEVVNNGFDVMAALQRVSKRRIRAMQRMIVEKILPKIVYDHPERDPQKEAKDAIDITLEHLFFEGFQTYRPKENSTAPAS